MTFEVSTAAVGVSDSADGACVVAEAEVPSVEGALDGASSADEVQPVSAESARMPAVQRANDRFIVNSDSRGFDVQRSRG
ncbi:hypothetical protein D3C74_476890 [compost metagenome]